MHLLVKFVVREVTRLIHPRAVVPVRLSGSAVDRDIVTNVLGFFVLFMISFGAGVFVMSEVGMDMPTSFGAVAATLGNIGPGLGDVGPTDNYSAVPVAGKWVLFSTDADGAPGDLYGDCVVVPGDVAAMMNGRP
ncbi:MAG: hypothetical protein CME24_03635 [Gemmatimonadetes bacterium]|nr:hypothetical protein [Gemmatimonadota bacterium]